MNLVNLTSAGALDAVEASASSFLVHELATKQSGIVQVDGITDATVQIQGRIQGDLDWVTLATFTSDNAQSIMLFPEMRINVSAYTSGTITAYIGA